jgi:hypothetical protein
MYAIRHPFPTGEMTESTGACFEVSTPAKTDLAERLASGWTARITKGSSCLVVEGPSNQSNYLDSFEVGLAASQEALDFFALRGAQALVLMGADTSHAVWWSEPRGKILRRMVTIDVPEPILRAQGTVVRADGTVPPRPLPPLITWQPSFRYFRLSQTTSDLVDSYRNMYLAFESLLGFIVPQNLSATGKPKEKEGSWLMRALSHIDKDVPLLSYATQGHQNPVQAVFDDIYSGTRTQVFHSKPGRPTLLPHSFLTRQAVMESLERLGRLYLDLLRHYSSLSRPASTTSRRVLDRMLMSLAGDVVISDGPQVLPAEKVDLSKVITLTNIPPERTISGAREWLAEIAFTDLANRVKPIRWMALVKDDQLCADGEVEDLMPLLNDMTVFQCSLNVRFVNLQKPRFFFDA